MISNTVHRVRAYAITAFALIVSAGVNASETRELMAISLDSLLQMTVDVSGAKAENIFKSVSVVSVIDRTTIERYHFATVSEAVEAVAGASVMRTYLKRDIPTIRGILQDHYANKVLIMINGVPAWNAVTGEASLNRVDINSVERIEVLKGPASVLYGTNAFMGAINIVLRKPESEGASGRMSGRVGSAGSAEGGAALTYRKDELMLTASGSAGDESGHAVTYTGEAERYNPYTNVTELTAAPRTDEIDEYLYANTMNVTAKYKSLSLLFNAYRSHESYLGVTPNYAAGAGRDHYATGYLGNLGLAHDFASWLGVKYMLSYDWQERNLSRSWNDAVRANVLGQRVTNSLNFLSEPLKNFTIQLGGDIDYRISNEYRNYTTATDSTISDNGMNNREIWEYSGVLQLGYSGKHFTALAGGRVTKSELYDPNWSARVTIVGQINDRNSIKAIFGQSYRSPSLFEQYFTAGTVTGNIDLNPEQCLSGEILYMGQYKWFFTQLGGYYANIQDRIFRVSRSGNNVYINGSEFNAWGGELELRFAHPKVFDAFVNYALTMGDSADVESGHYNFKYIPVHTGAAGISRSFGGFHVSALGNAMSSALGPQEYIGVQYTLDVSAGYTHQVGNVTLRHSVSAKNVTDQQIEYPEYVRRNTNSVPSGYGRRVSYEFTAGL